MTIHAMTIHENHTVGTERHIPDAPHAGVRSPINAESSGICADAPCAGERSLPLNSRRGSSAVFLCIILSALVSICFAFIYSTIEYTTASRADALMQLSGDSLLSEYDRDILDEYGLFLLRGNDRQFSSKLRQYLQYTFGQEQSVEMSGVNASGASFTASDPGAIREQILAYTKAGGLLLRGKKDEAGGEDQSGSPRISDTDPGRSLRHGPTIASLPSRQLPEQDFLTRVQAAGERLSDPGQFFKDGTDQYLLTSYVLNRFNSIASTAEPEHFFHREVEYILHGELTDRANRNKTDTSLTMLRLSPNLIHISTDPKKQEALTLAAEVITPGPAAALTAAGLAAAWAYAESANDAELLMKGYLVPPVKDESSWAIELDNVIKDVGDGDGIVRPKENKGLTYEQYLRILLALEDENLITARIMDLIQINMRKNKDGNFLIGECCSGIALRAEINRRDYEYEKIYQRILYR